MDKAKIILLEIAEGFVKLSKCFNTTSVSNNADDIIIVEEIKNDFQGNNKANKSKIGSSSLKNENIIKDKEEKLIVKKGSIVKRKDGRYMGRYSNKIKPVYAYTKKECLELLNKAIKDYENGTEEHTIGKKMTLSTWLEYWFNTYKKPALKESTQIQQKVYVSKINELPIAKKEMNRITVDDILVCLNSFNAVNTKKKIFIILKDTFSKAFSNGYLTKDITSFVAYDFNNKDKVDEEINEEIKILTQDEENKFLELLNKKNKDLYFAVKFSIYSGVRRGELFGIGLDDIDRKNDVIKINKQFNLITFKISSLKTEASKRYIPMFQPIKDVLIEMEEYYKENFNNFKRLFESLNSSSFTSQIKYYSKIIGFKVTPHMFRHTFASKCFAMGVEEKQVQKWLGHSSIKTTQDIYTHLGLGDKTEEKAIDLFNSLTHVL